MSGYTRYERDNLVELKHKLNNKDNFPIIRPNSTFEFVQKGSKGEISNFDTIIDFHKRGKHYKKLVKVTEELIENVANLKSVFPNFSEVIDHIEAELLLIDIKSNKEIKLEPLYIWGKPGIGKTAFIKALSKVLGVGWIKNNAGQLGGSVALSGSEPQWASSAPGLIVQAMMRVKEANFIFYIDELEKVKTDANNGDPLTALYDLLEKGSAREFVDQAFTNAVLFDATALNFIASGNDIKGIHSAILSRLNIFEVPLPDVNQMEKIVQNIYTSLLEEKELKKYFEAALGDGVIEALVKYQGSVRDVKKALIRAFGIAHKNKRRHLEVDDLHIVQDHSISMGFY